MKNWKKIKQLSLIKICKVDEYVRKKKFLKESAFLMFFSFYPYILLK